MGKRAGEFVRLSVSDGTTMAAYAARPAGEGPHPGLLVFQEAFGVNAHIRDVTERFAREGYTAIAPELFHRTGPGFEGAYDDFESTRVHTGALDNADLEADIRAAYDWLRNDTATDGKRILSVGFCMGGRVSFLANSLLPLAASASFYGARIAPANLDRVALVHAPMLFFWGGLDRHITPDVVAAVTGAFRSAGKPFISVEFSDADHGFFCNARGSYNAQAAAEAWSLLVTFFREHGGADSDPRS
ncbi:MAG TPA: dienelactone hydrolase family protein [Bacteroidota bacterium]|nr:dienelactone hydrolase family protein [Bacteroidota bacterium]